MSKFLRAVFVLAVLVVAVGVPGPRLNGAEPNLRKCAVTEPTRSKKAINAQLDAFRRANALFRKADSVVTVTVRFHVITSADGTQGNVDDATLGKQIEVMNKFYAGHRFQFEKGETDVIKNDRWFTMGYQSTAEHEAKTATNADPHKFLNIYTANIGDGLLGWATFPADLDLNDAEHGPTWDGVVLLYSSLPGGTMSNYDRGMTAVHEVGHWLGLYHTFQGGCVGEGDSVDDTKAQERAPDVACPKSEEENQSCPNAGGTSTIDNHMNYLYDACMKQFTKGQGERMREQVGTYRRQLLSNDTISTVNLQPVDLSAR